MLLDVAGVDDWALRKGRTYGSNADDLSTCYPTARPSHGPQIRLVARDRSTEYARGTTLGAPAAVQVADR